MFVYRFYDPKLVGQATLHNTEKVVYFGNDGTQITQMLRNADSHRFSNQDL